MAGAPDLLVHRQVRARRGRGAEVGATAVGTAVGTEGARAVEATEGGMAVATVVVKAADANSPEFLDRPAVLSGNPLSNQ